MLKTLWNWILKTIFGVKTETIGKEINQNELYAEEYRIIDEINFTSIFANKLANYAMTDSNAEIVGTTTRAIMLNDILQQVMNKSKKIVSMQLGYGGVLIVPYIKNDKLYYNIVEQNRMTIDATDGEKIVGATVIAEQKTITYGLIQDTYFRLTNYTINDGLLTITQKFVDTQGREIDISNIPEWQAINPIETITNVDRVPFGYIKCPINNRIGNDKYGVPITFGCTHTIEEIKECLKQIAREFKIKEAFVGVDSTMFKRNENGEPILPKSGLYRTFNSDDDNFWEEFSPDIRDSSYYNRLQELYTRLEKEIGTSKGILTDMDTSNATATEIKRALFDTFTLVNDIRKSVEKGLDDFIYACNVLANRYGLSPIGEYDISFDWDYSLLSDQQEEFAQYIQGVSKGVISKAELRRWLFPTETLEESQKAVEKIKEEEPTIQDLVGIPTDNNQE